MKIDSTNTALHTNAVKSTNKAEATNDVQGLDQSGPRMVSGPELVDYFADMLAYPSWSEKGLSLTQETKEGIFQAVQDAVREASAKSFGGFGTNINIHQIVKDNQDVPNWFLKEKQGIDQVYGSDLFPNGEYYSIDYKGLEQKANDNATYLGFDEHNDLLKHLFAIGRVNTAV